MCFAVKLLLFVSGQKHESKEFYARHRDNRIANLQSVAINTTLWLLPNEMIQTMV